MNSEISERYIKNIGTLTPQELNVICKKQVFIAGCGGLGGYNLEILSRFGILNITVADGDVFSPGNLNRQILSKENNIGMKKTEAAIQRVKEINSEVKITAHPLYIDENNAPQLLKGHDVIIDALDNVPSRLLLEKQAEALNIPLIHGAIQDWFVQIAVIMPGDRTLEKLYLQRRSQAALPREASLEVPPPSVPSFTPAFCASLQVSETVKLLCGKQTLARGQLHVFDLSDNSTQVFSV